MIVFTRNATMSWDMQKNVGISWCRIWISNPNLNHEHGSLHSLSIIVHKLFIDRHVLYKHTNNHISLGRSCMRVHIPYKLYTTVSLTTS